MIPICSQLGSRSNAFGSARRSNWGSSTTPSPPQRCRTGTGGSSSSSGGGGSGGLVAAAGRRKSPVTDGLVTVLKDELKIEKERYRTPDAVLEGPPGGYELEDRPQSNVLILTRRFGEEDIFVEVDLDQQKDPDEEGGGLGGSFEEGGDDEELDELPPVMFLVNIVKGDRVLGFSCETTGEAVAVSHVSLNDAELDEDEDGELSPYTGPVFTELDDTLQAAFTDYLEERGISGEFGAYLVELVHDKLEVEYMGWLTRVQDFVAS